MKIGLWMLTFLLLVTGCQAKDDHERKTDEEVLSALLGTISEVDSYEADVEISVTTSMNGKGEQTETTTGKITVADFDSPEMHALYDRSPTATNGSSSASFEYYQAGERIVLNRGEGWENTSGEGLSADDLPSVRYEPIVQSIKNVRNEVATDEEQDHYRVTYRGDSRTLFKEFKSTFSVAFHSIQPDHIESDLNVVVDQKSLRMKEFRYSVTGREGENTETVTYRIVYHRINEVDGISISEEILEEMSGTTTH